MVGCIVAARSIECGVEGQLARGGRKASCIYNSPRNCCAANLGSIIIFCGLEETQTIEVVKQPRKIRGGGAKEAPSYIWLHHFARLKRKQWGRVLLDAEAGEV